MNLVAEGVSAEILSDARAHYGNIRSESVYGSNRIRPFAKISAPLRHKTVSYLSHNHANVAVLPQSPGSTRTSVRLPGRPPRDNRVEAGLSSSPRYGPPLGTGGRPRRCKGSRSHRSVRSHESRCSKALTHWRMSA